MKEIYLGRLISERNPSIFELAKKTGNIKKRSEKRKDKLQRPKVTVKSANEVSKAGKRTLGKERINWPKSNSPEWERLDQDLSALLRILYAPAVNRAKTHPNIIYGLCKERFGVREQS